ncbi:terminase small subunit [Acidobacteria bacterium AH-259-L09]|nr:terminase small subunit [Acidobacteria bacterium AH-259-L09]
MRKPTPKQQHFIEAYIRNGGNGTQAALEAYDTNYATARVIGSENLTKPNVQNELQRALRKHDVSLNRAVKRLSDSLDAVDPVLYDDDGNVKISKPAHGIRLQASREVFKLSGAYPRESKQHQHAHLHLALINELAQLDMSEIDEIEKELLTREKRRKKLKS